MIRLGHILGFLLAVSMATGCTLDAPSADTSSAAVSAAAGQESQDDLQAALAALRMFQNGASGETAALAAATQRARHAVATVTEPSARAAAHDELIAILMSSSAQRIEVPLDSSGQPGAAPGACAPSTPAVAHTNTPDTL